MNDLAGRLNEMPGGLFSMIKDTTNILYSQLIQQVEFPENVSCSINTTNLL